MTSVSDSLRAGLFAEARKAPPCVVVLFGATGDLAGRKIAPALYHLHREGLLDERTAVLAVGRRPKSNQQFRDEMAGALKAHGRSGLDEAAWNDFGTRWHYHLMDADQPSQYGGLAEMLRGLAPRVAPECGLLHYLATSPDVWPAIAEGLGSRGLARPLGPGGFSRVVVEKPFGYDSASARELNASLRRHWDERQIFRIDHYLGKETVQNILVLRLANSIFEPLLNRRHVASIQITVAEAVGMEGRRGAYYDRTGALRDMVQNHILQVLAMLTMDAPASLATEAIRDERARLLACVRPPTAKDVPAWTVRGQYQGDGTSPGYRQEAGVAADSQTETYVAARLAIENSRWSGVPIYLRTGKRLAARSAYVVVQFRDAARGLFREANCDLGGPNRLVIQLQPKEGAFLTVDAKVPGDRTILRPVRMAYDYGSAFASASPEAYERLLLDALLGEPVLFIRDDEVEASWRMVDAIREVWDNTGRPAVLPYAPGAWGPDQAEGLFADRYERWYNVDLR